MFNAMLWFLKPKGKKVSSTESLLSQEIAQHLVKVADSDSVGPKLKPKLLH